MKTPFDLIKSLESWFFARAWDVVLADGKKMVVTDSGSGLTVTIDSSGIDVTGGDITTDGSVDGVDISVHAANSDAHHAESHTVASHSDTSATGSELNTLTDGSNADALHDHSAVGSHTIASHSDTSATGSELNTLTDGSDASSLHDHDGRYFQESEFSSNPGTNSKPLKTDSSGDVTLRVVDVNSLVVTSGVLQLEERSTPGTPPSGYGRVYFKAGGTLHYINDAGTEEQVATV